MSDSVRLSKKQINFLMSKFETDDPDEAVELLIESMVMKSVDPMQMQAYINKLMAKENN